MNIYLLKKSYAIIIDLLKMIKLLVIHFIIKFYARNNIFKYIKKNPKMVADIAIIKLWKKEQFIPAFAKVKTHTS